MGYRGILLWKRNQDRTLLYMKSVEGRMKKFNFLKEIFIITFPKFDVAIKRII